MIITNKSALENWAMAQLMIKEERETYYLNIPKKFYILEDGEEEPYLNTVEYWKNEKLEAIGFQIEVPYWDYDCQQWFTYGVSLKAKRYTI